MVDAQEPIPPGCGDGVKTATEACDSNDLGGATCASAAAPGWTGIVSCTVTCRVNIAGCSIPSSTWNSFTDTGKWTSYHIDNQFPDAEGFAGSAFDGRYLYLVPYAHHPVRLVGTTRVPTYSGVVVRYDTTSDFGQSGSWKKFDLAPVNAAAKGFMGGAFDGRYVYFVPHYNGAYHSTLARYDTQNPAGFEDEKSWSTFDVSTLPGSPKGFATAAFDGRYIYLTPYHNGNGYHGTIARYDTLGPFARESWETFDLTTIVSTGKGFLGSMFDGRYIYLAPYAYGAGAMNNTVMRFDTRASGTLSTADSWAYYKAPGVGFHSGGFDGRYAYFVQFHNGTNYGGLVVRVDTKADFANDNSWSAFNVATVNGGARGFVGATFDGQYLYLVPYHNQNAFNGLVARFDTNADAMTTPGAWSVFNMPSLPGAASATGYFGAGFDGQNVYFIPNLHPDPHGLVVQFDAKSPGWLPLHWNGGFN